MGIHGSGFSGLSSLFHICFVSDFDAKSGEGCVRISWEMEKKLVKTHENVLKYIFYVSIVQSLRARVPESTKYHRIEYPPKVIQKTSLFRI